MIIRIECYWNLLKENVKLFFWDFIWVVFLLFLNIDNKFLYLLFEVELFLNWKEFLKLNLFKVVDFFKGFLKLKIFGLFEFLVFVLKLNFVLFRLNFLNFFEFIKWIYKY